MSGVILLLADGRSVRGPVVKCKSCGADIIWGKTLAGKPCPYSVEHQDSHFKDCPNASSHSKTDRGKP